MKKVILLGMVSLMALSICAVVSCNGLGSGNGIETSGSYIDLGLSSGTKWKDVNEKNAADAEYGFFTYNEAISQFGNRIPTKDQWDELNAECQWSWTGSGYNVTGPNGNSITLPAEGFRHFDDGGVYSVGEAGGYWSSTSKREDAWAPSFGSDGMEVFLTEGGYGYSVRLVQD